MKSLGLLFRTLMNVIRSFIAKYFVDTNILDIANLPLTNDLSEILVSMFSN